MWMEIDIPAEALAPCGRNLIYGFPHGVGHGQEARCGYTPHGVRHSGRDTSLTTAEYTPAESVETTMR